MGSFTAVMGTGLWLSCEGEPRRAGHQPGTGSHPTPPSCSTLYLGYVREPLQDGVDPLEVILDGDVGNAVIVHDLHASQLVIGGVNFTSQHLARISNRNTDQSLLTQEPPLLAQFVNLNFCTGTFALVRG